MHDAFARQTPNTARDAAPRNDTDLPPMPDTRVFDTAPWPVLLIKSDGRIGYNNTAGAELAALISRGAPPTLSQAIASAGAGRAGELRGLTLPAEQAAEPHEGVRCFDIALLPWPETDVCLLQARETTFERRQQDLLRANKARTDALLSSLPDACVWETDGEGRFVYVSEQGFLGMDAGALTGLDPGTWAVDPEEARRVFKAQSPVSETGLAFLSPEGRRFVHHIDARPTIDEAGHSRGTHGIARDVSALEECKTLLRRTRNRERLLHGLLRISRDQNEPQAILNTAARGLLPALDAQGASVHQIVGDTFTTVAHAGTEVPEDAVMAALTRLESGEREVTSRAAETELLALATTHKGCRNGALCLWHRQNLDGWTEEERALAAELAAQIGLANDTLRREAEYRRLSETDSLTGLLNRRAFLLHLTQHLDTGDGNAPVALFYIDLDNFKQVNDLRGHVAGDEVLRSLARILTAHSRERDVAARLGGDEFALLLTNISEDAALGRAHAITRTTAEALATESGDPARPLGASVGIAMTDPVRKETATQLLERADAAMYDAKAHPGVSVRLADPPV
jgi:diguanylate cyclase (GGDEF)-like protein